ncbi:hypothetical protein EVAR_87575_1 [Eumeta japonica]|uniref:Uncharacterized protein n=1 Tax=Eumeta variegata TaxID=151549 RepID=A0A4C1WMV6_EUMVA|nr:hypothetical protein EVAR_87575_1 [Eumeta japonica]
MCTARNSHGVFNNRTSLFIIVLLSLKLCCPQDLSVNLSGEETLESNPDVGMLVPVEKIKIPRESAPGGVCRLSELLCEAGQCLSLDKYCNGEDDCGDMSDEPKACTRESFGVLI